MARSLVARRIDQGDDERGFVIALLALSLVGIVVATGFAIDLGTWYLRAAKLQRIADLASRSGATVLPDVDRAAAVANDALRRNGFDDGAQGITSTVSATTSDVRVNVRDASVPTYFLRILFPSVSIERSSHAQRSSGIPIGNPFNVFGYGSASLGLTGPVPPQGFWASINGPCDPKEDGDFFQARWDGNIVLSGTVPQQHTCASAHGSYTPLAPGVLNPDHSDGGYNYVVDVPASAGNDVVIRVFDPAAFPRSDMTKADDTLSRIGSENAGFDTVFSVTKIMGANPAPTDPDLTIPAGGARFGGDMVVDDGSADGCAGCWYTLAKNLGTGRYRVNVQSRWELAQEQIQDWTTPAINFNDYSLMASSAAKLKVTCDSRTDASCPRVSALGAASTYDDATNSTADYYLGDIDRGYAGSDLNVFLWDPGEGMRSIELVAPDGNDVPFTYTVAPAAGADSGGGPITVLDVSGTSNRLPNRKDDDKYNDRLVTLHFVVPAYTPIVPGDTWFRLRYKAGAGTVHDRLTFGVSASTASPVHLAEDD